MKYYEFLYLLALFISLCYAQDTSTGPPLPEWNGDPKICIPDSSGSPSFDPNFPRFPKQAEFALEQVIVAHRADQTSPSQLILYEHLYDYDANKVIIVKNVNGTIDAEYHYYESLTKSIYYRRELCFVTRILTDINSDGTSAIQLNTGWHVRPLEEYLLFAMNRAGQPLVVPKYLGKNVVRGIPVDQWESCIVDKSIYRTEKRIWSFAQKNFPMPVDTGEYVTPVQAVINASFSYPNGTEQLEIDTIFNVHAYRPGIIETSDQLAPPKGVFCDNGPTQPLMSLNDGGVQWPNSFSVRVDASSSRSSRWQSFHLHYQFFPGRGPKRIRYDYLPPGSQDFESVIHDYNDNLTYIIDRRLGTCKINHGVELPDVSPIRNPIEFFIKNEQYILFPTDDKVWEYNGFRPCRGNTIQCEILTRRSLINFPPHVDSDTGTATGGTWDATNVEYGWSMRSPFSRPPPNQPKRFDYPVYLYLRMYQFFGDASVFPPRIRTEDIEYEFYEMDHDSNIRDFDVSTCYRSLNYDYLHLGFKLQLNKGDVIDGNHLDRGELEIAIAFGLTNAMRIRLSRVSDLDVYHERVSNQVNVLFTLLGPKPDPPNGLSTNEPSVNDSLTVLRNQIDTGKLTFTLRLIDDRATEVEFVGVAGSLDASKKFMSTHGTGKQIIKESYTSGAEAGAIIGGLIVGLVVGIIIAAVLRITRKEPMPALPNMSKSFSNPLPSISFYNNKKTANDNTTANNTPTTNTTSTEA